MVKSLVDVNSFLAVESLSRPGPRDPWARAVAGELVNVFVYSERVRFPLPVPTADVPADLTAKMPSMAADLIRRDSSVVQPIVYSTADQWVLDDAAAHTAFGDFVTWAQLNTRSLRTWCALHSEGWIDALFRSEFAHPYSFSLRHLEGDPRLQTAVKRLELSPAALYYAFDSVLRRAMYANMAEDGEYYLNHPLRDSIELPTSKSEPGIPPAVPFSFRPVISSLAPKLSHEEFCVLLHTLRGVVRDHGLHLAKRGDYDRDTIRDVMAHAEIPARLRGHAAALGVAAGVVTGLGALTVLGPAAAVAGGAISVATAIWTKITLPRPVSRLKWLRWAVEWEGEDQAEDRDV